MEDDEQHGCGRQHNNEHSEPGVLGKVVICGLVQDLLVVTLAGSEHVQEGYQILANPANQDLCID